MTSPATSKIPAETVRQPSRRTRARHLIALFKRKKRILLLDDDPSMQRLAKAILLREGFRVDVFLTGRQAMAAIAAHNYDALLLDLMMPHEGGMTVIRHLREKNPALLRRVLLFTASPSAVVAMFERDVAGVVSKPFQDSDLIRAVRAIAEHA
jgi:DNA-binding response OmpR family regulator